MVKRILLIAALSAITACSKVATQTGAPSAAGNPHTIHGVLRWGLAFEPDSLNPLLGNQQVDADLSMFWAGYLFNWNDRNAFEPELAERVPTLANGDIARDGLSITYHLRRGVTWQDGAPFSADDVIFTWRAVMNPKNNVGSQVGFDDISTIDKKSANEIVVHLKKAYAPFIATFFTMSGTPYPILPAHVLAKYADINKVAYNRMPIGTGPFQVVSYEKGRAIKLVANRRYWRGAPGLREIDISIVPDQNTLVTQLKTGEIDFEYTAPSTLAPTLSTVPYTHQYLTPFTQFAQYAFNVRNPILSDVNVRRALAYALDRQSLSTKASHGIYTVEDTDQPSFLWAHNPHATHYGYDPARAAALLDAAGWRLGSDGVRHKGGTALELTLSDISGSAVAAAWDQLAQSQWRAVGAKIDIKSIAAPIFFASYAGNGTLQTGAFEIAGYSWVNGVDPDDSTQFKCDQFPPHGQNVYHFCSIRLDADERAALTTFDQAKRKAAYDDIQAILADQVPMIVIGYAQRQDVASIDLHGYKPAHAVTTFWNTWEWSI